MSSVLHAVVVVSDDLKEVLSFISCRPGEIQIHGARINVILDLVVACRSIISIIVFEHPLKKRGAD